jgi:hypothetical protein
MKTLRVHRNLVMTPIRVTPAPQRGDHAKPDAKPDPGAHLAAVKIGRRRDIDRRRIAVRPIAIGLRRVVDGHIHHRGVDRLDDDLAFVLMDRKLGSRFQLAGGHCAVT